MNNFLTWVIVVIIEFAMLIYLFVGRTIIPPMLELARESQHLEDLGWLTQINHIETAALLWFPIIIMVGVPLWAMISSTRTERFGRRI